MSTDGNDARRPDGRGASEAGREPVVCQVRSGLGTRSRLSVASPGLPGPSKGAGSLLDAGNRHIIRAGTGRWGIPADT
jgi:hypothetical protein